MSERYAGLILADSGDGSVAVPRVGGRLVPQRAAILWARAGIATIYVAGSGELRRRIAADPRVAPVVVAGAPGPRPGPLLACDAGSVFDAAALAALLVAPGEAVVVVRDAAGRAVLARLPASVAGAELPAAVRDADASLDRLLCRAAAQHACSDLRPAAGVALRITRPEEVATVERRLVAAAGNVRDGRLDRALNRRLSRPLTRLVARTPLAPNHVTILALLLGLGGAALVACHGYLAPLSGVLLLQAASVLDCCDGELARLRLEESALGHWLDVAGDTITHAALFAAIGIVTWREGLTNAPALAVLLVVGIAITFACVAYAEETAVLRVRAGGRVSGAIDSLVSALTTRDYLAVVVAFAVADRLAWFLAGAAIGVHVFWLTLLTLLIVERRQRTVPPGAR
jgi:phosphatidylglycerophosphate synthase